jgi:hypothetical protein
VDPNLEEKYIVNLFSNYLPINCALIECFNASKSTSVYSVCNYYTILRNGTGFKLGDDLDVSERQLLLELRRIILIDKILDVLVERILPKPCKISRGSHDRMSTEKLWSTIWGKVVTNIYSR